MSMIMSVARGSTAALRRFAQELEDGPGAGEPGGMPPAFSALLASQRGRLETLIRSNPQYAQLAPLLLERLRAGTALAGAGGGGSRAGTAGRPRPETLDLHKSWHILHYLLSGRADEGAVPPSGFLLEGGEEVGEDLGYGPARLLSPALAAQCSQFAAALTVGELLGRIDGPRMAAAGVYCAGDGGPGPVAEMEADVRHYFPQLQAHLAAAAAAREALLVWLS